MTTISSLRGAHVKWHRMFKSSSSVIFLFVSFWIVSLFYHIPELPQIWLALQNIRKNHTSYQLWTRAFSSSPPPETVASKEISTSAIICSTELKNFVAAQFGLCANHPNSFEVLKIASKGRRRWRPGGWAANEESKLWNCKA